MRARISQQSKQKRKEQKLNPSLSGMMFLPDGRVLIMDKEVYQKTLE
jgi:hypothetical protein